MTVIVMNINPYEMITHKNVQVIEETSTHYIISDSENDYSYTPKKNYKIFIK